LLDTTLASENKNLFQTAVTIQNVHTSQGCPCPQSDCCVLQTSETDKWQAVAEGTGSFVVVCLNMKVVLLVEEWG